MINFKKLLRNLENMYDSHSACSRTDCQSLQLFSMQYKTLKPTQKQQTQPLDLVYAVE